MFCPSSVELGSFINTPQWQVPTQVELQRVQEEDNGGNGVWGLAGGLEASESSGCPEGVPGDTRSRLLGAVDMVGGES